MLYIPMGNKTGWCLGEVVGVWRSSVLNACFCSLRFLDESENEEECVEKQEGNVKYNMRV